MPTKPADLSEVFRLGEVLGRGGSATVYSARPVSGRIAAAAQPGPVALKVLDRELATTVGAADAFFAEARALERISHPNVVRVLGYGSAANAPWIAFEQVTGSSIATIVGERGSLEPSEAVVVADGILRGLEAVHAAGLVHRDLTPVNVLVVPTEAGDVTAAGVRLLDFGLADAPGRTALAADVLRAEREVIGADDVGVIGSAGYLSPEHALGLPVDERGDLYQVAALLHLMLTGRPPFPGETAEALMAAHVGSPPPVPSVQDSAIPAYLDRFVVRGMQKRAEERFSSATEMRAALLSRAVPPVPVHVPVPPPGAYAPAVPLPGASPAASAEAAAPSRGSRSPSLVPLIVIAAGLAAAIAAVWFSAAGEARPHTSPPDEAAASQTAKPAPSSTVRGAAALPDVAVPDLVGLGEAAAEARLRAAGLHAGRVIAQLAPSPAAVVLATMPSTGVLARKGSAVDLVVASGANAVPSVAGETEAAAVAALQAAGFAAAARVVSGGATTPGSVVASEPSAGAAAQLGSTVTLLIGGRPTAAPASPATPAPASPTPTREPAPTVAPTPTPTPVPSPTPSQVGHGR